MATLTTKPRLGVLALLSSPLLNKGTGFTAVERKALGLTGLLPPEISSLETQAKRTYIQYEQLRDALSKNNASSSRRRA